MQAYELKTSDGISLLAQKWNDVEDSERSLLIVHGLGEHQNRYAHVAEHFVKDGFHDMDEVHTLQYSGVVSPARDFYLQYTNRQFNPN